MQATRTTLNMLAELRKLLADALRLRNQGGAYAKLARTQGYVDGYMRAMIDSGSITQRDLLILVAEQREMVDGPATKEVEAETVQAA